MIIDFHTHIFPDAIAAQVVDGLYKQANGAVLPAGNGSKQQLMEQMQEAGIDNAVLCPIATKPEQFESILNFSLDIANGKAGERAQRTLIPFGSIHPDSPDCFKQLEKIATQGIKGVKLHPFYQKFTLGSERAVDIMRCCRDLGLIVMCHCGLDIGFPNERICTPVHVLKIHEKVDGIKFIAAHLGGWNMWKEVRREILGEPVYLDTAVLEADLLSEDVQEILHRHPAEKLLLASDWPWCPLDKPRDMIQSLDRSAEDIALILGGNARRLLDLCGA